MIRSATLRKAGALVAAEIDRIQRARVGSETPHDVDEEFVPHPFNSRTPYEPGDDRDIWCKDCDYHRDHSIHAAASPAVEGGREDDLRRLAAFCEQVHADGLMPSRAWFAESAETIRAALHGRAASPRTNTPTEPSK